MKEELCASLEKELMLEKRKYENQFTKSLYEADQRDLHIEELRAKLLANEDLLKASETLVSELEGKSPSLAAEVGGVSKSLRLPLLSGAGSHRWS